MHNIGLPFHVFQSYRSRVSESREHRERRSENEMWKKKKKKIFFYPFQHSYNTCTCINVTIFNQGKNFYFNNWSFLRKKSPRIMIYMHSGEQKRQNGPENQMARRTKWPEEPSCAWRTDSLYRSISVILNQWVIFLWVNNLTKGFCLTCWNQIIPV